jgi:hypothetical protein
MQMRLKLDRFNVQKQGLRTLARHVKECVVVCLDTVNYLTGFNCVSSNDIRGRLIIGNQVPLTTKRLQVPGANKSVYPSSASITVSLVG